jgi:hypothetical protein
MRDSPFSCHPSDALSVVDEEEYPEINEQHGCCEYSRNNRNAIRFNPSEDGETEAKGQSPFASNKYTKQLGCITIITIDLSIRTITGNRTIYAIKIEKP